MNHVGYGVFKNGKPVGIQPMAWAHATEALARYKKNTEGRGDVFEIVPLYAGAAISAPFSFTESKSARSRA